MDRWDTEAINSVIGVPWRMTDGRWAVDRPEAQVDPTQSLRCRLREHESRGRESPSKTLMSSEPRSDAQVAMQSKTRKEHRHTQIAARRESKNASEPLRIEQKGWIEEMRCLTRHWPKRYGDESRGRRGVTGPQQQCQKQNQQHQNREKIQLNQK